MKQRPTTLISFLALLTVGCGANNAIEEHFGYCFAYHSTVTKQLNQYQENFRPVLARADPDLANDFAMRWIKEYFEAMTEQGKQQKIAQAQNSCRKLSLPH